MTTLQNTTLAANTNALKTVRVKIGAPAPMPVEPRIAKRVLAAAAANDSLYNDLEARYGGAFAQWVVDSLNRTARNREE